MREVIVGGIYKHFKGNIYKVLNVGFDADDSNRKLVIYKEVSGCKVWVREYSEFLSKVDREKYPGVKQIYRFEEIKTEN